ncbi:tetratricopeptide repeat protein [Ammoniphilus sp. YIM 78166]|uniref:tetratricopeptide repeat protein n=1 Tax=Ammoniphilus sp. YIM 78166 TaxID=1644106 RepID=UPI00106FF4CE|nr:tetratricopeptide repeat protein [Ammoniphilus sp. YIM 78166]
MLVKHLFCTLLERLEGIEEKWSKATSQEMKERLLDEVMELRGVSDDILDQWLLFEERMSKLQQKLQGHEHTPKVHSFMDFDLGQMNEEIAEMSDEVAEKIFQELMKVDKKPASPEMVSFLSGQAAHQFRKGQGYYNLLMYGQAAQHFQAVLKEDPDQDVARLFLAFSYMMDGVWEQADHQFYLLSQTTENRLLKATALNAQGCLLGGFEKWEQALSHFESAISAYPKLRDPYFNKGLVHMKLNQYQEAKPIWQKLSSEFQDDWEVLLQLAKCYQAEGEPREAEQTLTQIYQATEDPDMLWPVAQTFEDLRQFGNAALCYQMILQREPDNAFAWHGLGWNLWHEDGLNDGIQYIRKALSLSPNHPDFQFSYGWILFHRKQFADAQAVFEQILQQEGSYPLAVAGLVHVHLARQDWRQAESYCSLLLKEETAQARGLGYLQLGKVCLAKGEFQEAKGHFEKSIEENAELRDSFLWLGLVCHLLGEKEEALRIWERTL